VAGQLSLKILFLGTSRFAVPSLETLAGAHEIVGVVTQPDRAHTRKGKTIPSPVKESAQKLDLPVFQPETVNRREWIEKLGALGAELSVVVAFGQKFRPRFLRMTPRGAINLHGSLLPAYRGAAPIARAIADGLDATGLTVFQVTPQWDTGGVFANVKVQIGPDETEGELSERMAVIGAKLLLETVNAIAEDRAQPVEQNPSRATFAPKIEKNEGDLDWDRPAQQVYNQFRAMTPHPGAFTLWHAEGKTVRLKILASCLILGENFDNAGEVSQIVSNGIIVACRQGALLITRLQAPGGKPLSAKDFLNGHPIRPGHRMSK
jgi:methionyl-tRNA formyltransferase